MTAKRKPPASALPPRGIGQDRRRNGRGEMQDQTDETQLRAAFLEGMSRSAASVSVVTTDGPAGAAA
jgi:hypothetical protein